VRNNRSAASAISKNYKTRIFSIERTNLYFCYERIDRGLQGRPKLLLIPFPLSIFAVEPSQALWCSDLKSRGADLKRHCYVLIRNPWSSDTVFGGSYTVPLHQIRGLPISSFAYNLSVQICLRF